MDIVVDDSNVYSIKIPNAGIKLITNQTRIQRVSADIIEFNFKLDAKHLNSAKKPSVKCSTTQTLQKLICKSCNVVFSDNTFRMRDAPSENFKETSSLWQCHDECYDHIIDPVTKMPIFEPNEILKGLNTIHIHQSVNLLNIT